MRYQRYRWEFEGRRFDEIFTFTPWMYDYIKHNDHDIVDPKDYDYYVATDPFADDVLNWIAEISLRHGVADEGDPYRSRNTFLRFCLRFVQSIDYMPDQGGEYPRYPSELMMDGGGDCEDSAILLALFARSIGYECAFLEFSSQGFLGIGAFGHIDLGIAPSYPGEFSGMFWQREGTRYFYAHCNGYGRNIGDRPNPKYRRARIHPVCWEP